MVCGQYCVAMITGKPIEEIYTLFGHWRGTNPKQVKNVFSKLGIETAERMQCMNVNKPLPDLCMIKIVYYHIRATHWAIVHNSKVYDPYYGIYNMEPNNNLPFARIQGVISTYLEIKLTTT